jgi:MFS superfamily sulfate permease-like transporter
MPHESNVTWTELWTKIRTYKFDPFWDSIFIAGGIIVPLAVSWYTADWWPGYPQNICFYILGAMAVWWFL